MAGAVARRQVVRALALGLVAMAVVAPTPLVAAQDAQEGLRWASLGDSFAAGEGLEHPSRASQTDQDCQRALAGDEFPSVAWGAAAAENRAGPFAFVACTGAITDDLFPAPAGRLQAGQRDQAIFVSGQSRFDVVTFSFGGNNIGFDDVLLGCAGLSATGGVTAVAGGGLGWAAAPWVGCTLSEQEMKDRIDALTDPSSADGPLPACNALGDNASTAQHWDDDGLVQGRITLPELYDVIGRCVAAPGGTVVVMGYPQLLEEADRWSAFEGNRCERIRRADIGKLRGATAHLNFRISEAVAQANATTPANFVFVDPNHFWEGGSDDLTEPSDAARNDPGNRHALCGGGEDWLNGVTIGLAGDGLGRPQRSFHPKQQGQDAMARAASTVGYDLATTMADPRQDTVVLPSEACGSGFAEYVNLATPLFMVDGLVEIPPDPPATPSVGIEFDHPSAVSSGDLDGDGLPEILAVLACYFGGSGSGYFHEIVAFDENLEPLGIVPMGADVDPDWSFLIEDLTVRDRSVIVTYRAGENDEPLCCGSRLITDVFVLQNGQFVRSSRVDASDGAGAVPSEQADGDPSAGPSPEDTVAALVDALNRGDRAGAEQHADPVVIEELLSFADGGPLGGPIGSCTPIGDISTACEMLAGSSIVRVILQFVDDRYRVVATEHAGDAG